MTGAKKMNVAVKMPDYETRSFFDYETRAMPESEERRNNYIQELESIIDKAKMEKRYLSTAEQNRFDQIKRDIQRIDQNTNQRSFDKFVNVKEAHTDDVEKRMLFEEQSRHLMEYLVKGELRNLTASASGGAIVPEEIAKFVVDKIVNQSPILQQANLITTNADISVPVFDYTQLGVGYITENVELVEASQNYASVKLTNFIIAGLVKCSRSLVNRADFPVLEYLLGSLAKRIGLFLENQLILGTGTGQLRGLTTLAAGQTITTGAAGTLAPDEIITLMSKLPSAHAENGVFLCNPTTWATILKFKTTDGDYLFNAGNFGADRGNMLLGRPLYVSDAVPSIGTGSKFLYFLDPQAITVKMTEQIGVQVLDQTFASSYNYGLLGYCECDSAITSSQGVAALVGA